MFTWKEKYHWDYSAAGFSTPEHGPAITGAKIFRGGAFKNAVRETMQNSGDAKNKDLPDNVPVRVEYEFLLIDREDIPGADRLSSVIDKCYDYMKQKPNAKLDDVEVLAAANQKHLKSSEKIPVLRIGDYNTKGLEGEDFESLLNLDGITNKNDEDSSGSFGYGKYAPFLLSSLNTILYSTRTRKGKYLFQGRSFLSTFKEDGIKKQGVSLFGYESDDGLEFLPITDPEDVPSVFQRTDNGTDLYVIGFEKQENWMDYVAINALENFFYAIHINKIEVVIKDGEKVVELRKDNLPEMITTYKELYEQKYNNEADNLEYNAHKYWRVIESAENGVITPVVDHDFRKKGEVKLYILMGDGVEDKSVLEMRSSGMKIQDKKDGFKGLPPFNGVLIATGAGKEDADYNGNISKFLRRMESPAHNSWQIEDVQKEDMKREARLVIEALKKMIRDAVKDKLPKDDDKPVDMFGLNRILPDITEAGSETIEEEAVFNFVPLPIKSEENNKKSSLKHIKEKTNGRGHKPDPDPRPRPDPDPNRIIKPRNNRQREKVVLKAVSLLSVRSPYLMVDKAYRLSFVPGLDADPLMVHVNISGDDSKSFETVVTKAIKEGKQLIIKDGYILIPKALKGQKETLLISLSESNECALEVRAYVKK